MFRCFLVYTCSLVDKGPFPLTLRIKIQDPRACDAFIRRSTMTNVFSLGEVIGTEHHYFAESETFWVVAIN